MWTVYSKYIVVTSLLSFTDLNIDDWRHVIQTNVLPSKFLHLIRFNYAIACII